MAKHILTNKNLRTVCQKSNCKTYSKSRYCVHENSRKSCILCKKIVKDGFLSKRKNKITINVKKIAETLHDENYDVEILKCKQRKAEIQSQIEEICIHFLLSSECFYCMAI
jgi:hypothetical protein